MALRATPTIAICLAAGVAAGIALSRPADQPAPVAAPAADAAPVADAAPAPADAEPDNDSPYLVDGADPVVDATAGDVAAGDAAADAPAPVADPVSISIEGFDFSSTSPVAAGSPIAVTNLDGADHTLTARNNEFDTGVLGVDQLASFAAPATPGTYEFFCVIHPSMTGQLVVS